MGPLEQKYFRVIRGPILKTACKYRVNIRRSLRRYRHFDGVYPAGRRAQCDSGVAQSDFRARAQLHHAPCPMHCALCRMLYPKLLLRADHTDY